MEIGNQICSSVHLSGEETLQLLGFKLGNVGNCGKNQRSEQPGPQGSACTLQVLLAHNSSMESQNDHVHFWETCGNFGVLPWFRGVYTVYQVMRRIGQCSV